MSRCTAEVRQLTPQPQSHVSSLGMGDQIKRYCEKLEPEEYEEVLDNEARMAEGELDSDPNCFQKKDRGREVSVCR